MFNFSILGFRRIDPCGSWFGPELIQANSTYSFSDLQSPRLQTEQPIRRGHCSDSLCWSYNAGGISVGDGRKTNLRWRPGLEPRRHVKKSTLRHHVSDEGTIFSLCSSQFPQWIRFSRFSSPWMSRNWVIVIFTDSFLESWCFYSRLLSRISSKRDRF